MIASSRKTGISASDAQTPFQAIGRRSPPAAGPVRLCSEGLHRQPDATKEKDEADA